MHKRLLSCFFWVKMVHYALGDRQVQGNLNMEVENLLPLIFLIVGAHLSNSAT